MTTWLKKLWGSRAGRPRAAQPARGWGPRLAIEQLEDRTVPASYAFTAATVPQLIADIEQANALVSSSRNVDATITLVAGKTFTLSKPYYESDYGPGFPAIAANNKLTIVGNGDVIQRSTNKYWISPFYRFFDVAPGASLTLKSLTLQRGAEAQGGAIYNAGSLQLYSVTLQENVVLGDASAGGAIYSSGSLTMQDCIVQNNKALGSSFRSWYPGGTGAGGGLYISGGTASLTNVRLYSNTAQGGNGGSGGWMESGWGSSVLVGGANGGSGYGGGMYVAGGTVSLDNCTIEHNSAVAGTGGSSPKGLPKGSDGQGIGGGLYVNDASAVVCLDAATLAQFFSNSASTDHKDIYGSYTICP